MGELIYCKHAIAANPFYLEGASHNVYSLEELSYYVRENPYIVTADFMTAELCDWVGEELLDRELSYSLKKSLSENVPLHLFVSKLLLGCGYLTKSEIKELSDVIEKVENLSEEEKKKIHADQLLLANKLIDAIFEYDEILAESEKEEISEDLIADICHNEGTAYAWLFFFEEASLSFERAFTLGKRLESLSAMLFSAAMMENTSRFSILGEKYKIPQDKMEEIREEVESLRGSTEVARFSKKLSRLRGDYSDQDAYMKQLLDIMSGFTDEYKKIRIQK